MSEKETPRTLVPTAGVPFDDQVRIIRAYVALSNNGENPVHYKDVMRITRLGRSQISGINSFMVMLGLLEFVSRGHYTPTEAGINLCRNEPGNEDFSNVSAAVGDSLLSNVVRQYLDVHGGGTSQALVEYIMEEAGTTEQHRVRSALEWLIRTGLLVGEED